jgi:transcriptional regulator with XRE-family HTH domain
LNILKKLRAEADISLKNLAKETGVDQATISQLENDRRKAHLATVAKLARYFERPIEDFEELLDKNGSDRSRRGGLASVAKKVEEKQKVS